MIRMSAHESTLPPPNNYCLPVLDSSKKPDDPSSIAKCRSVLTVLYSLKGLVSSGLVVRDVIEKTQLLGLYMCMYGPTCNKSMDQPGKVANPARGQLNGEK